MEILNERPDDMPADEDLHEAGHICLFIGDWEIHLNIMSSEHPSTFSNVELRELVLKSLGEAMDRSFACEDAKTATIN